MMENAVVWVAEEPSTLGDKNAYDLSPATLYGALKFVFPAGSNVAGMPGQAAKKASFELQGFNPDRDYILPLARDPMAKTIFLLAVGRICKKVNILKWERNRDRQGGGAYVPTEITLK